MHYFSTVVDLYIIIIIIIILYISEVLDFTSGFLFYLYWFPLQHISDWNIIVFSALLHVFVSCT